MAVILFKSREPRPIVVVITAREVGKPSLRKHCKEASRGLPAVFTAERYSGKIYMQ